MNDTFIDSQLPPHRSFLVSKLIKTVADDKQAEVSSLLGGDKARIAKSTG
jgi:hypothetical protein